MRRALLILLLAVPAAAAKKKGKADAEPRPAERRQPAGYVLFARVAKEGKKLPGAAADPGLPTDRSYFNLGPVTVSLDAQYCLVNFNMGAGIVHQAGEPWPPMTVLDRGCTGSVATAEVDWGSVTPRRLTQSELDRYYSSTYDGLFRR